MKEVPAMRYSYETCFSDLEFSLLLKTESSAGYCTLLAFTAGALLSLRCISVFLSPKQRKEAAQSQSESHFKEESHETF